MNVHAEHVGSLLRPAGLLRARAAHARGERRKLELVVETARLVWG